jgi:hypothetical protein
MVNAVAPDVVTSVRNTPGEAGRMVHHTAAPTMAPVTTTAAALDRTTFRREDRAHSRRASVAPCDTDMSARLAVLSSTKSAVVASIFRFRGSFVRQMRSSVRTGSATSGGTASQSGSSRTTAPSTSVRSSPSNARLPVSIS